MEKKYRAIFDDGHNFGEFEFYSKHRAKSKDHLEDAKNEFIKKFGVKRYNQIRIVDTWRVD